MFVRSLTPSPITAKQFRSIMVRAVVRFYAASICASEIQKLWPPRGSSKSKRFQGTAAVTSAKDHIWPQLPPVYSKLRRPQTLGIQRHPTIHILVRTSSRYKTTKERHRKGNEWRPQRMRTSMRQRQKLPWLSNAGGQRSLSVLVLGVLVASAPPRAVETIQE